MLEGTTENSSAASGATGAGTSGAGQPVTSSGTASAAMIAAASAASSADSGSAAKTTEDTSAQAGAGGSGATSGASGQPAAAVTGQPAGSGEAPDNRIQAATKNARAAAIAETEARFAAFKGMDPENVNMALGLLREIQSNPQKFLADLRARLEPEAAAVVDEEYPDADLVSQDGKLKTYRDETLRKMLDINAGRVKAALMKELAPFIDYTRTEQGRRAAAEQHEQRITAIKGALTEARTFPHFTEENEPAILATLQAIPEERRKALGPVASLHMAYSTFLRDKVFPSIDTAAEKRVRDNFNKKAAGGTGTAHPTDQGGENQGKPVLKNESDLSRHMERLAATMDAPG